MTPTEQDKELEATLLTLVWGDGKVADRNVELIMQLITADRKRVALEEWDIANEAVLKNYHVISDEQEKLEALALVDPKSHNDKIGSYMDRAFGFDLAFQPFAEVRRKRIAELKAQQEGV